MAALLPTEAELAPLETAERGFESEPQAGVLPRLRGLRWPCVARTKRTTVAAAGAAVLLLAAAASLSSLSTQPRAREAEIRESVELAASNATAEVMAAKFGWAVQYRRSEATTYNRVTNGPRLVQRVGMDYLQVYVDPGAACSIVFAGSNAANDCWGPQETTDVPECGMTGVHRCFFGKATVFWKDSQWSKVAEFLSSPACQGGVHSVGWSLGGTIASIFATCANNAKNGMIMLDGEEVQLPRVASLLTFAAPGVGEGAQPLNGQSPDGVFKGVRMWNERPSLVPGKVTVDGCAWAWRGVNMLKAVHAKTWAMSLREAGWLGGPTEATLYKPSSQVAKRGKTEYGRLGICVGGLHFLYGRTIPQISSVKIRE